MIPNRCEYQAGPLGICAVMTVAISAILSLVLVPVAVHAQGIDPEHRPISEVAIEGLDQVSETLVRNQIRIKAGEPYSKETVEGDIVRLTHLGRFETVQARVTPQDDGSVVLTYVLQEQPLLAEVQFVGNKAIYDGKLAELVRLRPGDPIDSYLIARGKQQIIRAYEQKGFFVADVSVDEELLSEQNILIFRVREGPKVRIKAIRFEGNERLSRSELKTRIRSESYFPILNGGELNRSELQLDAGRLREYYNEQGFLAAQVGRRIDLSPNQKDAVVVFVIDEGEQFSVSQVIVQGNEMFTADQIRLHMDLKPGSTFATSKARSSMERLRYLYGNLGFLDTQVQIERRFHQDAPRVDLVVIIEEGSPSIVGRVNVRGNDLTQNKVILRQVRGMTPGRPFDREGLDETRQRLSSGSLFSEATVTILGEPGDPIRDVLIDVKEKNTGSIGFGAGVSSDVGVIGAIDVQQRNFDITDWPDSWAELFNARAFRGAGQTFALSLQPGLEQSRYSVSFREPYLLESNFFFDVSLFYFQRQRTDYDEQRVGGGFGFGRRISDTWTAAANVRAEDVLIDNIEPNSTLDVFEVEGGSLLTALGLNLTRSTTDNPVAPSEGSRLSLNVRRYGTILGGDYEFTRVDVDYRVFWTVEEDFMGRKSIVSLRTEFGYIFEEQEAPIFERFYAGGHRSFRGFSYRGVGPRGINANTLTRGDDPVGGEWLMLASLQYQFPIWDKYIAGVVFTDQGTVDEDLSVDKWRVSVGSGVRLILPIIGQIPFAVDFAFPVLSQDGDEQQFISFDLSLPLR